MNKWEVLNRYRRQDHRPLLVCPSCHEEYSVGIDESDEPLLWDFYCDATIRPGTLFWESLDTAAPAW